MAVFITLETDSFVDVYQKQVAGKTRNKGAGISSVRRPQRGLEIKEDTYAIIKVVRADGTEIRVTDSGTYNGTGVNYANFILQSVQEARMEKSQIVETFGEPYIFFFGQSPRFLDCMAVLINSNDFNWQAEWWDNYDKHWRGTKLVEQGARIYLFYDDNIVEGYMMTSMANKVAGEPHLVQLQFRLFVTNYSNISFIGNTNFPIRSSVLLPAGIDLTDPSAFDPLYQLGQNPASAEFLQQQALLAVQRPGNASYGTLNDLLRQGLISAPYPGQDIDTFIRDAASLAGGGPVLVPEEAKRWLPIRSRIVDNVDEWTGAPPVEDFPVDPPQGVDDFPQAIIDDSPDTPIGSHAMKDLGVLPPTPDPDDDEIRRFLDGQGRTDDGQEQGPPMSIVDRARQDRQDALDKEEARNNPPFNGPVQGGPPDAFGTTVVPGQIPTGEPRGKI